jgi:hypothetical protein
LRRLVIGNQEEQTFPKKNPSGWERQQLFLDRELDRNLIICRGC